MTDNNPQEPRARGQAMRSARLARVRMIRRRIVAGSLALFVAAWLLISIVLVSGHDPALAAKSSSASTAASGTTTTTTTTADSTPTTTADSTSTSNASSSSNSGGGTVSSVTTSQS
jgi:hypothetical protein